MFLICKINEKTKFEYLLKIVYEQYPIQYPGRFEKKSRFFFVGSSSKFFLIFFFFQSHSTECGH